MVRKIGRYTITLLVACLLLAMPMQALASDVYEGNISSAYKEVFVDILNDVSLNENYLLFRSGQYEYTMIYGDISYDNGLFISTDYLRYVLTVGSNSYNNNAYNLKTYKGSDFSLEVGDYLVYSDLAHYPKLIERGVAYEYAILVALVVGGLCLLIRPIFKNTYRFRSR